MLTKRIIPCLDCDLQVPEGRVVKGIEFKEIKYAGNPVNLATRYYEEGADEIVVLDITASHERRSTMDDVIDRLTENVFMPICVGGGIRKVDDYIKMLRAGADKCSTNTAAIKNPKLLTEASKVVGSQAVVIAVDAKRRYVKDPKDEPNKNVIYTDNGYCWFDCSIYGGREFTGIDAIEWAQKCQDLGVGEILLTSMDGDGTQEGYDIELNKAINDSVDIPVIASGGVGKPKDILDVFKKTDVSAALAASIFHFNQYSINEVKNYLNKNNITVRL